RLPPQRRRPPRVVERARQPGRGAGGGRADGRGHHALRARPEHGAGRPARPDRRHPGPAPRHELTAYPSARAVSMTYWKMSGATMVASLSTMWRGVSGPSFPHVIFSLGTAPEEEP